MQWQIQEAKNKLSEVINLAVKEGPQKITRHGKELAVLLSTKAYQRLQGRKQSLADFFQQSPLKGLSLERDSDATLREVNF